MNGKEYRPGLSHAILASAILVPVFFILISLLLWILFNTFWGDSHLQEALWIALPVSVVSGFLIGQMFNRTLRVSQDSVQFFLFGRMYRSIPFEGNTFSAGTRSISYDGLLPLSGSPCLIVTGKNGSIKEYPCEGLSPAVFNAFISEINSVSSDFLGKSVVLITDHDRVKSGQSAIDYRSTDAVYDSISEIGGFAFPQKEYLENLIRRMKKTLLIVAVIGIFFVGLLFLLYWDATLMPAFLAVGVFFFLLFCGTAAQHMYEYFMIKRWSPSEVRFSPGSFSFDSTEFILSDIEYIKATPPRAGGNITRRERQIVIKTRKKAYRYTFGNIFYYKSCYYIKNYGELWNQLDSLLKPAGKIIVSDN